ncbi:bifunctional DNA-formamidopyrimidine glycosylase/DNA-(apurinic or apyrimidinic site) lyase [Candidatus Woesearchaeota archaeon]|nr:bifunctional DNA-formamidopyrimidine glycosylase/DNA-(apurinic or apyrimidinic site) lyase [Candidatus Woesearchaeota archaeon]
MPELPEVETIVRQLRKKVLGRKIVTIKIKDTKVIDKKVRRFVGKPINSIERRGKTIIISSDKNYLVAHLRMTGHFYHIENKEDEDYQKYLAGIFYLNDKSFFTFNEIRRFGSVKFMNKLQLQEFLQSLGQEPLDIQKEEFVELLRKYPSSTIKNKLLDQRMIAGIGNIYAQEALYHAGIDPRRKMKEVSTQKLAVLHREMQRILKLAIEKNGTTVSNYSHLDGKGNFQDFLVVYQKEFCPRKHPLQRLVIGGRGTYYCKECQK